MSKLDKCNDFANLLKSFKINFERHSEYHIQVQREHNFYPSNNTYYNSESGKKISIPKFKCSTEFLQFLSEHTQIELKDTYNNTNAFPISNHSAQKMNEGYGLYDEELGMTLRDYFAAKALVGVLRDYNGTTKEALDIGSEEAESIAYYSYKIADAMLKKR